MIRFPEKPERKLTASDLLPPVTPRRRPQPQPSPAQRAARAERIALDGAREFYGIARQNGADLPKVRAYQLYAELGGTKRYRDFKANL